LASALVRALVAALHALDRHAKPPEPFRKCPETVEAEDDSGRKFIAEPNTLSPGGVIPSDAAPPVGTGGLSGYGGGGGTTERMLAARAVAGVLGVLAFGSGASGAGVANERSLAPPPGVDLTGALVRATKHGELVVTVPWVVSFYVFFRGTPRRRLPGSTSSPSPRCVACCDRRRSRRTQRPAAWTAEVASFPRRRWR
jgi:hypothetical protein